jgi:hypothetical protein
MYSQQSEVSSEINILNFGYLSSRQYIYVTKDVLICGYFSKSKEVHEQKKFGKYWSAVPWLQELFHESAETHLTKFKVLCYAMLSCATVNCG